jgi:hypothetical protein
LDSFFLLPSLSVDNQKAIMCIDYLQNPKIYPMFLDYFTFPFTIVAFSLEAFLAPSASQRGLAI